MWFIKDGIKKLYRSAVSEIMLKTNVKCNSGTFPLPGLCTFSCFHPLLLEMTNEADSPVPSYSRLHSESSIPEELGSPAADYMPCESTAQEQPGSPDHSLLTEDMVFSQELESSTSPSKHVSFCVFVS